MTEEWSADRIQDATYRAKFLDVPKIIADWTSEAGGIAGKDVLDFGCGEGTMAVAMAVDQNAHRVVGVDVHREIESALPLAQSQLGLRRLPDNLQIEMVDPSASLEKFGSFDVIYSWSVFEHIQQDLLLDCLAKMKRVLRPQGVMFLQTTPLFYSAYGSHLEPWIPVPWAHLSMQQNLYYAELRKRTSNQEEYESLLRTYETLNRATDWQIIRAAKAAGFEITREHRTYDDFPIPDEVREIYKEEALRTNQLVFLAKHATEQV
ncbi:SAM-dependent methyltransferase [Caballeronia sordidicola]|uniref:SAM-dependent methyltransferase n=1 Tax=Caballeronia sordidicola TaxID=196367 RepID=UPI0004D01AAA|nr:class I SAM-dependent methyltransferase [Caballeronia sordidicola]